MSFLKIVYVLLPFALFDWVWLKPGACKGSPWDAAYLITISCIVSARKLDPLACRSRPDSTYSIYSKMTHNSFCLGYQSGFGWGVFEMIKQPRRRRFLLVDYYREVCRLHPSTRDDEVRSPVFEPLLRQPYVLLRCHREP